MRPQIRPSLRLEESCTSFLPGVRSLQDIHCVPSLVTIIQPLASSLYVDIEAY